MTELTQEIVKELLDYDPETGLLTWKERTSKWFDNGSKSSEHNQKVWNSREAGNLAFETYNGQGYKKGYILSKPYKAHRIIWLWWYGEWPKGNIDHINQIRDDNRIENLRVVTQIENCKNQVKRKNNTSGVTGVYFDKACKKWIAQVFVNRNKIHLGVFVNFEDAVKARKEADIKYGFHKNHGKDIKL